MSKNFNFRFKILSNQINFKNNYKNEFMFLQDLKIIKIKKFKIPFHSIIYIRSLDDEDVSCLSNCGIFLKDVLKQNFTFSTIHNGNVLESNVINPKKEFKEYFSHVKVIEIKGANNYYKIQNAFQISKNCLITAAHLLKNVPTTYQMVNLLIFNEKISM